VKSNCGGRKYIHLFIFDRDEQAAGQSSGHF
jgi:hypothetical protein